MTSKMSPGSGLVELGVAMVAVQAAAQSLRGDVEGRIERTGEAARRPTLHLWGSGFPFRGPDLRRRGCEGFAAGWDGKRNKRGPGSTVWRCRRSARGFDGVNRGKPGISTRRENKVGPGKMDGLYSRREGSGVRVPDPGEAEEGGGTKRPGHKRREAEAGGLEKKNEERGLVSARGFPHITRRPAAATTLDLFPGLPDGQRRACASCPSACLRRKRGLGHADQGSVQVVATSERRIGAGKVLRC